MKIASRDLRAPLQNQKSADGDLVTLDSQGRPKTRQQSGDRQALVPQQVTVISVPTLVSNNFVTRVKGSKSSQKAGQRRLASANASQPFMQKRDFYGRPNSTGQKPHEQQSTANTKVMNQAKHTSFGDMDSSFERNRIVHSSTVFSQVKDGKKISIHERPHTSHFYRSVESSFTST